MTSHDLLAPVRTLSNGRPGKLLWTAGPAPRQTMGNIGSDCLWAEIKLRGGPNHFQANILSLMGVAAEKSDSQNSLLQLCRQKLPVEMCLMVGGECIGEH